MSYLDELDRELSAAGLSARRRRRILAEFADHLHVDPKADLGEPAQIARQFAEELGSSLARSAALRTFLALATAIAVLLTVAGVIADDPYDGALRGIADAATCLTGYAVLGRYLNLRPARN